MARRTMLGLSAAMIWIVSAAAQESPPSYQADPTVYKVIFEDQNFRVIAGTWKKGTTDKPHSHPSPSSSTRLTTAPCGFTIQTVQVARPRTRLGRPLRDQLYPRTPPKMSASWIVRPFLLNASNSP